MTITSISYKQKFPTFQFLNCDIGFDGSLGDNENPLEALKKLKTIAEAFHKQEFPHMYELVDSQPTTPSPELPIIQVQKDSKEEATQRMINEINSCANKKTLETYRLIAKSSTELQQAFDNKLKTLQ